MSNISINVSNESPANPSLPANCPPMPAVVPLSPNTVASTLIANPDLDAAMLQGIARSLVKTSCTRKLTNRIQVQHLKQQIIDLQRKVNSPTLINNTEALERCKENVGQVPNFTIPIRNGLFQPTKYIKQLDDRWVVGFTEGSGLDNLLWITHI